MNEDQLSKTVKKIIERKEKGYFTLAKMVKVIKRAVSCANNLKVGVTIVIMRNDQVIQMTYHMPNAILVSSIMAPKKAWTALAMQEPTKNLSKEVQPGAELFQMETMTNGKLTSCGGGIPLLVDGQIIGSIGVSGGTVDQDHKICTAAVNEFLKESD